MKPPSTPPSATLSPQGPEADAAEIRVADAIGRLMHFWGFKRPMGRIWTVLYLNPEPVSAAELSQTLKMSAGAVSMALAELEKWGAVTRTWVPGERRDYFVAEDSIWKLVQRVVKERELGIVKDFGASLDQADSLLQAIGADAEQDLASKLSYKRDRLRRLSILSQTGEALLTALVEGDVIDPTKMLRDPS